MNLPFPDWVSGRLTLTTLPLIVWLFSLCVWRIVARLSRRPERSHSRQGNLWGFSLIAVILWGVCVELYKLL